MLGAMNISVNGQSQVPPGFRFHPTEEELLHYYLRKKVAYEKIDLDVIRDVDLNKIEPWVIQEMCKIGSSSTPQNDWYFFSHKDKKYPTGTRTNRATAAGFWKATGRDKVIYSNLRRIGMRKTLVFYRGRAPHGLKSDWIMHEYRLDDHHNTTIHDDPDHGSSIVGESSGPEEGWVVCRVFKKKNYHKSLDNISTISISQNDGVLNQILTYMGRSSSSSLNKPQNHELLNKNIKLTAATEFLHLPGLIENPTNMNNPISSPVQTGPNRLVNKPAISDWATVDRLVACQLNEQYSGYGDDLCFSFGNNDADEIHELDNMNNSNERSNHDDQVSSSADNDFWTFIRTSLS